MTSRADLPRIVAAMKAGGYYRRVMSAGAELDRVKAYLRAFEAADFSGALPDMDPTYPPFPGLRHEVFHDPASLPGAAMLERSWRAIRDEAQALDAAAELDYTIASRPVRRLLHPATWLRRHAPPRAWTVYPLHYMGVEVEGLTRRCPRTLAIVNSLPGLCVAYPWGDAVVSVQGPGSRLPVHCSIDNLRVRCHLALRIPEGAGIRVGGQERRWEEGRCLVFEDAFAHEVWNDSAERRVVLIVDFWHPDLTPAERQALEAGFRKAQVRRIFLGQRIGATGSAGTYVPFLEAAVEAQEADPALRDYWEASSAS